MMTAEPMSRVSPAHGQPLNLEDRERIDPLLSALDCPLSEYSFANLYLFREIHRYRLLQQPAPCILGVTYDGEAHAMPLVPLQSCEVPELLEHASCIYPLPREAAERAALPGFELRWNEADSDYVYRASRLASLEGAKLRTKRAQARSFEQSARPSVVPLNAGNLNGAWEVLELWARQVPRPTRTTDYDACSEALRNVDALGLSGLLVSDAMDRPCAFLLASRLGDQSAAVHFAKGNREYSGVYPYLFSQFAACAGVERLNFEQDLGASGLRQAKRALDPADQLRKYRLSRRQA
jgi:hypothetical protein